MGWIDGIKKRINYGYFEGFFKNMLLVYLWVETLLVASAGA